MSCDVSSEGLRSPRSELEKRTWPAPAKLNLMLRIVGRRGDGYHLLQTVFRFLDYGDRLRFRLRDDGAVERSGGLPTVPPERDLVVRAARLLKERAGAAHAGVDIGLEKRLPEGGGLGGGSSDAATTLVALNRLWDLGLDTAELERLGLQLGADVPVFVRGRTAWAEGVGEHLTPLDLPPAWYLVLAPNCRVSTAGIFNAPDLTRDSPPITIRDFLAGSQGNDCLPVVRRQSAEVSAALDWLGTVGIGRLTGTGACVFAEFDGEEEARAALARVPERFRGFVARGLNRSPLYDAVRA
jgi:4-diphosphocytidyl-2-C-methyl-D-erythritol kinase